MTARAGSIGMLADRDRVLVEERNKAVYSGDIPPRLKGLNEWLDRELYDSNYPSAPHGSRWNDARYGPTVQFLAAQARESGEPFEAVKEEMSRWAASRSSQVGGSLAYSQGMSFIREFSKTSRALIRTDDPLEPFATPDRKVRFCINDFPDEPLWTLHREGRKPIQFDDWPGPWRRPQVEAGPARGKYDRIWFYTMAQYRENLSRASRDQDQLSLALRRWHWRIENRRQAIEELRPEDREILARRARFILGRRFPEQTIARFEMPHNDYEHYFGVSWGGPSPTPIRYLQGVVQLEQIEYGPTIGYFFSQASKGRRGKDGAMALLARWAEIEPPSYQEFLRQVAAGNSDFGVTSALANWFEKRLMWQQTSDFDSFYKTKAGGAGRRRVNLSVRINDFPDERMFSLFQDGIPIGDFNDWPKNWEGPKTQYLRVK